MDLDLKDWTRISRIGSTFQGLDLDFKSWVWTLRIGPGLLGPGLDSENVVGRRELGLDFRICSSF